MPRDPAGDRNIGRVLGGAYRLVRLVAEGGTGKVYEALDVRRSTPPRVAIKLLRPAAASDEVSCARFRREAEIASQLGHPHIVKVMDFGIGDDGVPYLVMELLEGRDLRQLLTRGTPPRAAAAEILEQMGSALQAVHDRGVVHRDLKPADIFLVKSLEQRIRVKLLDFGLSKIKQAQSSLTQNSPIFGTPFYMAPEFAEGRVDEIDHRADIFATAVIAYQCLTGRPPFDAPTPSGVLYQICNAKPRPASELARDLSPEIDDVLAGGLAKRKSDRPDRVESFTQELCRLLRAGDSVVSAVPPRTTAADLQGEPVTRLVPAVARPQRPVLTAPQSEVVTRVEPSRAIDRTTTLEPLPGESGDQPESLERSPTLAPPLEAAGAPMQTLVRSGGEVRRDVWTPATRLFAALLALGLLGLGTVVALLIIGSVPEEDPSRVAGFAAPAPPEWPDAAAQKVPASGPIPDARLPAEPEAGVADAAPVPAGAPASSMTGHRPRHSSKQAKPFPRRRPAREAAPPPRPAPRPTPAPPPEPAPARPQPEEKIRYDEL